MKNLLTFLVTMILFSGTGYGLFKSVQRADRICSSYASNSEQYHDCLGI